MIAESPVNPSRDAGPVPSEIFPVMMGGGSRGRGYDWARELRHDARGHIFDHCKAAMRPQAEDYLTMYRPQGS